MPSRAEILRRNAARGWLPAHEVEMLYSHIETLTGIDKRIDKRIDKLVDNTSMSLETLAGELLAFMDEP
jgi:hypothetical protein